jgi:hypothetical protein
VIDLDKYFTAAESLIEAATTISAQDISDEQSRANCVSCNLRAANTIIEIGRALEADVLMFRVEIDDLWDKIRTY